MPDLIRATFPSICSLLTGSSLDHDIDSAVDFANESDERLRESLEGGVFQQSELMWHLAAALSADLSQIEPHELDRNIAIVTAAVGAETVRGAYRKKLLVNEKNSLGDTRYELAVTAKACAVLDASSIELEKPLPNGLAPFPSMSVRTHTCQQACSVA